MSKFLLKGLIISKGFTMSSFAEASDIEYQRLKRILSGDGKIRLDDIVKICRVLKLSPLIFFPPDVQKLHEENIIVQNMEHEEEHTNDK